MFRTQEIPEKYIKNIIMKIPIARLYILNLLSKEPMCGNRIAVAMIPEIDGFERKINPNVLYPLLHNMEKEGFIKGKWEHPTRRTRRIYTITPKGRKMLKNLKEVFKLRFKKIFKVMKSFEKKLFGEEI